MLFSRIFHRSSAVALLVAGLFSSAQVQGQGTPKTSTNRYVNTWVWQTGHFKVHNLLIPATLELQVDGGESEEAAMNAAQVDFWNYLGFFDGVDKISQINDSSPYSTTTKFYYDAACWYYDMYNKATDNPELLMQKMMDCFVNSYTNGVIWAFKSQNVESRFYHFHVPVTGHYIISTNLKGGWDNPNNKVKLVDGNGNLIFDWHDSYSSDRAISFQQDLVSGDYTIMVGLGSGSTASHTAGTLTGIQLSDPIEREFDLPIRTAWLRVPLAQASAGINQTSIVDIPYTPPTGSPAIPPGGGYVTFSVPAAQDPWVSYYIPTAALNNSKIDDPSQQSHVQFYIPVISNLAPATYTGTGFRLTFQQKPDAVEDF